TWGPTNCTGWNVAFIATPAPSTENAAYLNASHTFWNHYLTQCGATLTTWTQTP
ncbi:MAG: hypothetical protein GY788_07690, partial [bacterium]|nr:hypothetical protein [bacterium]